MLGLGGLTGFRKGMGKECKAGLPREGNGTTPEVPSTPTGPPGQAKPGHGIVDMGACRTLPKGQDGAM